MASRCVRGLRSDRNICSPKSPLTGGDSSKTSLGWEDNWDHVSAFFIGTEGGDIIHVMRLRPTWGVYVALLSVVGLGAVVRWSVDRVRAKRRPLSVTGTNAEGSRRTQGRSYLVAVGVWLAASMVAVVWLSRIAG